MRAHTYDHRVDELFEIAGHTEIRSPRRLDRWDRILDPDVTTLAGAGIAGVAGEIADRAIIGSRRHPDAAIIGEAEASDIEAAVAAARRFVYCVTSDEAIRDRVKALVPSGRCVEIDGVLRIEKEPGAGYRVDAGSAE